jgi:thymidylate synthase ThyX
VTTPYVRERFTREERAKLKPYFTNLDGPVFALVNLPEVVKGALFARYSRTSKSLRRLFLDEFAKDAGEVPGAATATVGTERAERLYDNVFFEYGDDSVAQLGGVHLACEQASQLLAKAIEWGRLAAYLEQSTRYMRYDDKPGGRWRLTVPPEIEGTRVEREYLAFADRTFETYGRMFQPVFDWFQTKYPKDSADSDFVYRSTITAKTCDTLRMLLPAGTRSNLGVYADGQAFESMLLRMRAHPLAEVREYADLVLRELRKVIPSFLKRVELPDRGVAWSEYLRQTREDVAEIASKYVPGVEPGPRTEVTLVDYDPAGEEKVVAAALYASTDLPDDRLHSLPTWASEATAGTSPGARSSELATGSTCSATSARSATSSATACSRSSGRSSRRSTDTKRPLRSPRLNSKTNGARPWRTQHGHGRRSPTRPGETLPSTSSRWPIAFGS